MLLYLGILTGIIQISAASSRNDNYYTAGVVEFRPCTMGASSNDILKEHLSAYVELIRSQEANETDIIIFPEGTLNSDLTATLVPEPSAEINLCSDISVQDGSDSYYEPFLKDLSCAARNSGKYLVVNIKERERCIDSSKVGGERLCGVTGWNMYNTNVVFNRSGHIVSRYRKWHVYLEPNVNKTMEPEYAIFETDFGVKFGHFICFDILFYTPAQELVKHLNVHDIIFTSLFFSELPFLTASQLQQSWAWGNNVNLLAAGASLPMNGATGSGIYSGVRGSLVRIMADESGMRQLLVAQVPKNNRTFELPAEKKPKLLNQKMQKTGIRLLKDPQLHNFNSELLNLSAIDSQNISRHICHEGYCCSFQITTEPLQSNVSTNFYRYRIGVFNGQRSYEQNELNYIRICALYACTGVSISTCAEMFEGDYYSEYVKFTYVSVKAEFLLSEHMLIMPSTLDTELYSLNANEIKWSIANERSTKEAHIELLAHRSDLITFGIYANYYDRSSGRGQKCSIRTFIYTISFFCIVWEKVIIV